MKRLLKALLGLIGAVILLLVIAAVLLPVIYDKEDLKIAIATEVQKQTGRELSIAGALDFTVFPWLAVEVSDLSLSNAPGFGEQPFAQIGEARVGVALVPLFKKQISVDEVTLTGLELALAIDERGRGNWEDLATGDATADTDSGEPGMFSSKRVAGLNIRDAAVEFHDRQAGAHYRLNQLSMQTGALGDGKPVTLELDTNFEDVVAATKGRVTLGGIATVNLDAEQFTLDDFEFALETEEGLSVALRSPQLDLDLAAQTLQLNSYTAKMASLEAEGSLSARQILDAPAFSGTLVIAAFSPAKLMEVLNMEAPATSDPDVLQQMSVNLALSGGTNHLALENITMELDDSRFTGNVKIEDIERQKVTFGLNVDQIDLDRYMAPADEESSTSEEVAMPTEELRGPEVEGLLNAGNLRMAGLDFSDAEVGVSIRNGKLRLHPLTAGFYGGRYQGDVSLDSSSDVPMLSLDEKIDSITFQRLVAELVESESLSGTAQGHVRLTGRGKDSSAVMASLQGDLGLTLAEGALEGINIWYEIRRGMALYKGLAPPEPEPERTVFSRMQVAADVQEGVINTRELVGELPFLTMRGNGTIDLRSSQADLGLVAKVHNSPDLANDPLSAELRGMSFPFRIKGPLDAPSLEVDWKALLKGEATEMLLDKLLGEKKAETGDESGQAASEDEAEEKSTEDQLKDAATGALFDLLGGKDKDKEDEDGEQ